jgi:hypothetical protein
LIAVVGVCALALGATAVLTVGSAGATPAGDETAFRNAFANAAETQIDLTADIVLTCTVNPNDAATRLVGLPLVVDGHGFVIRQSCAGSGVLENLNGVGLAGLLTLQNVTITGGTKTVTSAASGVINGGGVYSDRGLTLDHTTVTINTVAGNGGNAGGAAGGPLTVVDSTISGNTAEKNGGGLQTSSGEKLVITRSVIDGNTATTQNGGGFSGATQAAVELTDSTISDNHSLAGFGGGGTMGIGPNTISGTTFSGNSAATNAGAVRIAGDDGTEVVNSTFTGNTAGAAGGAIFIIENATLTYVTIAGNTAATATAVAGQPGQAAWTAFGTVIGAGTGTGSCDTQATTDGYNFEQGGNTCGFGAGPGDVVNGGDPVLGALGANGGPTETRLPAGTSPLLDKIPAASPCGGVNVTVDQRGLPRPITAGTFCDIGAVEIQPVAALLLAPDFTG